MELDWVFPIPVTGTLTEHAEFVRQAIEADPAAAAITDAEAEEFFVVAYMLRSFRQSYANQVWRAMGVPPSLHGPKGYKRACLTVLRRWREPKVRELLVWAVDNCGQADFPDVAENGAAWTQELFVKAYDFGINPVWLVRVKRYLGAPDDWDAWLDSVNPWARLSCQVYLNAARLGLRRHVYNERSYTAPVRQVAAAVQPELAQALKEKDRVSGSLRHGVRHMERSRKTLKDQVRQQAQQAREMLAQARGEVAAARRALVERRRAHERELEAQARQFEKQLAGLRERLAAERKAFVQSLSALPRIDLLEGRKVAVDGDGENREAMRVLVESLGGRLVAEGAEVTLAGGAGRAGVAALERHLRDLALQQVLIRCDGLCRRKPGRPAIAASGFVARLNGPAVLELGSVVSCGPLAGSLMAEYGGLVLALRWLVRAVAPRGATVEVWSDCRVMLARLRQPKACRWTRGCVQLDRRVRSLLQQLQRQGVQVTLKWVPRDEVDVADRLCDRTYRAAAWYHRRGGVYKAPLEAFLRA